MHTTEDYLANITPSQLVEFERIRKIVKSIVPDADEVMSYGIPTFKYLKKPLLYFGAFANHVSIFPAQDPLLTEVPELNKYRTGKGTFQYSEKDPIPSELVEKMVRFHLRRIKK